MAVLNPDALVDPDDVKEIIDTNLTDARINAFINMAVAMTSILSGELDACGGDDTLESIQLLLAAHFLTLYERTAKSESIGGQWSVTWAIKEGPGLESSLYGQAAMNLDCSGLLSTAGWRNATFNVVSYYQLEDSLQLFDEAIT